MIKKIFPELRTSRTLLRQFNDRDLDNVFRGLSHPSVIRYYGVSYRSPEDTKEQLRFFANLEEQETGIWWAICSPEDSTFFGAGGLNNWSKKDKKAEIGFWLLPEFWYQGLMSECVPAICRYGFEHLDLHRIEGFVETENKNCKNALRKLGFELEGTMRDCEIKNGKFICLDIFAQFNSHDT